LVLAAAGREALGTTNGVRCTMRRSTLVIAAMSLLAASRARAEMWPQTVPLESVGFERIASKDGVAVYQHRTATIIRLGADAVVDATPEHVEHVLLDYRGQVGKIGRLSESRILDCARGRLHVYQRLNLPIISDRDFNLAVKWGQLGDVRWISYSAVPSGTPARKGIVRLSHHEGSWQLKPVNGGRSTQVRFMVSVDMGGLLPRWLARSNSAKEMPVLFQQVKRMLRGPDRRIACSN
jgi:hypothetical protein